MNPVMGRRSGFTLVELVVVIAILGILAGIGHVGYGGYLKHAEKAADMKFLEAVNMAFATACEEHGVDRTALRYDWAALRWDSTGKKLQDRDKILKIKGVTDLSDMNRIFAKYYSGNEDATLKYYTKDSVVFKDGSELFAIESGRSKLIEAFKDSSLSNGDIDALFGRLKMVFTKFRNSATGGKLQFFFGFPGGAKMALAFMISELGKEGSGGLNADAMWNQLVEMGLSEKPSPEEFSNALIVLAAKGVSSEAGKDPARLMEQFNNGQCSPLVQIAMKLCMAQAYYDYASEDGAGASADFKKRFNDLGKGGGIQTLLDFEFNDTTQADVFQAYKESDQYRKDFLGCLSALSYLDQHSGSLDLKSENCFDDPDLLEMFKAAMGAG